MLYEMAGRVDQNQAWMHVCRCSYSFYLSGVDIAEITAIHNDTRMAINNIRSYTHVSMRTEVDVGGDIVIATLGWQGREEGADARDLLDE